MKLEDYCDAINARLVVTRYENQGGRWSAKFDGCEVKLKGCLESEYGGGASPAEAIADYIKRIKGKCLVFGAYTPTRTEFNVPESLEA